MHIEQKLYDTIRQQLPILCVDILILNESKQFLLTKRRQSPAKDSWWFPGGRVHKCETITEAAKRKGREELGVDLEISDTIVSVEESIFINEHPVIHTVNIVVKSMAQINTQFVLDESLSEYQWFSYIDSQLHPCVKAPLKKCGFSSVDKP